MTTSREKFEAWWGEIPDDYEKALCWEAWVARDAEVEGLRNERDELRARLTEHQRVCAGVIVPGGEE